MKKSLFIGIFLVIALVNVIAEDMPIGGFGTGFWEDPRYSVIWEFQSNGIRLLDKNNKEVLYDFKDHNPDNVKVNTGTDGIVLTFTNIDRNWKYRIKKGISLNADLEATITLPNGQDIDFPLVFSNFKL